MFHLFTFVFLFFVGSAYAVDPTAPLAPGTFVLGKLPDNLSPNCKQGENSRPYFVAPSLPGRVPVGHTQVWTGAPTDGGTMVVVNYRGQPVPVIPPAEVLESNQDGVAMKTNPVKFWYCLDGNYQDFGGTLLSGPSTAAVIGGGVTQYLGNFYEAGKCGNIFVALNNPSHQQVLFNSTRCK